MTPGAEETSEAHIKPNQTKTELFLQIPQAKASEPSCKTSGAFFVLLFLCSLILPTVQTKNTGFPWVLEILENV